MSARVGVKQRAGGRPVSKVKPRANGKLKAKAKAGAGGLVSKSKPRGKVKPRAKSKAGGRRPPEERRAGRPPHRKTLGKAKSKGKAGRGQEGLWLKKIGAGRRGALKAGLARARREGWIGWVRSYQDAVAVAEGCWFDEVTADRAVSFIETFCYHWEGEWAGRPFVLMDWQRDEIVKPLFGWKRRDGTRRYRRAFIFLPKKNGKSTLIAAIQLLLLVMDQEPGAQVYSAATDRDQARITWECAANMVRVSEDLSAVLHVRDHISTIVYADLKSKLKALSAVPKSQEGRNIHGLAVDELHAWTDRRLWGALRYGGASRRQPLFIVITTAGDDLGSLCYEEYEYASKIRDGIIEMPSYLSVIYEAAKEDDWTDPKTWRKANPGLGVTIWEEELAEMVAEALSKPASVADFKRYRLNLWMQAHNPWMEIETWDKCGVEGMRLEDMAA